jgi:hypothetical protein
MLGNLVTWRLVQADAIRGPGNSHWRSELPKEKFWSVFRKDEESADLAAGNRVDPSRIIRNWKR